MPLVYEDDFIRLFHGKMEEETEWLTADTLVTDPPYGMDYFSGWAKRDRIHGDQTTETRDRALAMWGEVKPAIVFGTWRVPRPPETRQLVIWHKGDSPGMGDLALPWGPSHEDIYILGGHGAEFWVGPRGPSVIRSRVKEGSGKTDHNHPTPKPVYLMQTLISHTVGVIADPFAGSGSTLVAAKLLKRKAIGVEMEVQHIEDTIRRLERIK